MTVEGITSCSHSKAEGLVKYKDDSYDDFSLTHIQMQAGGKLEVEIDKQSIVFILQGNIRFDDFDLNGKQFDTFYIEKGNRLKIVAMENDSMMFIAN